MTMDPIKDAVTGIEQAADHLVQQLPGAVSETATRIAVQLGADEITVTGSFEVKIGFGKKG